MFCEYLLLFYLVSICGWVWEVGVYWISHGFSHSLLSLIFSYRGVLHGIWAPIYGVGFLLLVMLWQAIHKRKALFYPVSMAACAFLEYGTAVLLEKLFAAKWWDYSGAFWNLDGKICFVSVAAFGALGATAVMLTVPLYEKLQERTPVRVRRIVCILISILFLVDVFSSMYAPNMGLGVSVLE